MTDFATLGIVIDSTSVPKAVGDLDRLTTAGARAEAATLRLGGTSKAAAVGAAAMAAQAQASARGTLSMGAGATAAATAMNSLGSHTRGASLQIRESLVLMREAAAGSFARMAGSASILAGAMTSTGTSVGGLVTRLLTMVGVLKVTENAELALAAADAAAAAAGVKAAVQRAAAGIVAADTELALAQAAVRVAATSEAEEVAQVQLAAAHEAVAAAAAEATIAENALAVAQGRAASASAASNARTVVGLGRVGVALGATVAVAGVAFAGIKSFQDQVGRSGELNTFAEGLRLTDAQIEAAGGSVKYLADRTREVSGLTVTYGDIAKATFNVILERAGVTADGFKSAWQVALEAVGRFGKFTAAILIASFGAVIALVISLGSNLGKMQLGLYDQMTNPLKDMKKQFLTTFNDVNAGFDKIGQGAVDAAKKRLQTLSDSNKPPKGPKAKKQSDHGLADALAELDAQIKGQLALAAAYQVSDAAAIRAEAHQKAEEQAIRHKGDVGLFYEKELALAVATRAADGGKLINQLSGQTAAQRAVNDAVAAGSIDASQASNVLRDEAQLRPLIAAQAVAEGRAKDVLAGVIARLRKEQAASNAETERAQVLAATASANNEIDRLELETKLIGENNAVRAVAIARLQAEQFLKAHPLEDADAARAYIDAQIVLADKTAGLATAQDNYNASLTYTVELFGAINEQAEALGGILTSAFGDFGNQIGGVVTALTGLQEREQAIADWKRDEIKSAGGDANRLAQIETLAAKKSATARMQATGQAISGLKGLFKEHSAGYKIMSAIEKGYALFQAVQTIAAIARDATHTASSVANSAVRATADQAAGGAKMFAQLGVWAFPVVAAMVAVLAALGLKGGGGGGGGGPSIPSADDLQGAAGTGSVLGDAKAKSESIAHSLEIVAANSNKDLEYSNAMLRSLRNIDFSIAKLAGTVAQQIQVSGSLFDTSKLKLGSSGSGGFLGIGAKSTTRTLWDLGLNLQSASVADIIANGIAGTTYQTVQKVKKKSGFFGIGGGTKTSYSTTTGTIDPEIVGAIQGVVLSLRDGLIEASKVIGLEGAEAILNSFNVSLGKISFKDMTGEQIEDQLNAIFSKVGDDMAAAVFPALAAMQKIGEGLFETFIRVAREYQVVDVVLDSIGKDFGAVGIGSVAARDALVQLFGSLDDFVDQTAFFRDQFLTDAEQIAPIQAAVVAELQRLGVAGIATRDQFKAAVLGLDLTTAAGREMYASLLAVAPAFDKVLDYFDQIDKAATQALQSTVEQFTKFAESLTKYRDTLFATDRGQTALYATLRARFASTAALAASGDATALGGLETAGKDFLTAAKNNASSWLQYQRDVALVARGVDAGIFAAKETADYAQLQLDALRNATTILQQISTNTEATAAALAPPPGAPQSLPSNETSVPVVEQQNATIINQNATIIALLQAQQRLQSRWDGDGLLIRTDADTPIQTEVV